MSGGRKAAVVIAIAALAAGCAGRQSSPLPSTGGLPLLPAPASLMPVKDIMFTDSDRRKPGAGYDTALPASHAVVSGSALTLSPMVDGLGDSLGDYAYAIYHFVLPGYADSAVIRLSFTVGPEIHGNLWVALANQQSGRWDPFPVAESGTVNAESLLPYLEQDNLWMAVIAGGLEPLELATVMVGDDVIPLADIAASPDSGSFPLEVTFSAAASSDSDGSIVKYEWDLDGDGLFELDSGVDLDVAFTYETTGSYSAGLRVTDDRGATATDTTAVSVNDPAMVAPIADLTATPAFGDAPLQVTLDASGSTDDTGIASYDFDVNGDGSYEVTGSTEPTHPYTYSTPDRYTAVVRVHDLQGATDTAAAGVDSNAQPVASLALNKDCGRDVIIQFSASGSYEEGGSITAYEFDWNGDGTYDNTVGPEFQYQYTTTGIFTSVLRVTDDDGETATASRTVYPISWTAGQNVGVAQQGSFSSLASVNGRLSAAFHGDTAASGIGIYYLRDSATSGPPGNFSMHRVFELDAPFNSPYHGVSLATHTSGFQQFPGIAFTKNHLRYARALVVNPQQASDWDVHTVDAQSDNFNANGACDLEINYTGTAARAMIIYGDTGGDDLHFAYATESTPDDSGDWEHYRFDSSRSGNIGFWPSMTLVSGTPAVTYVDKTTSDLIYAWCIVGVPDDEGDWFIHTADSGAVTDHVSVGTVGGLPVIAYRRDGFLCYARATTLAPQSSTDWVKVVVDSTEATGLRPSVFEVNGRPAIAYNNSGLNSVHYAYSRVSAPTSAADWCLDYNVVGNGQYPSLTVWNGQRVFSAYQFTTDQLILSRGD